MLVVMARTATEEMVARVCEEIRAMGLTPHAMSGVQRTAIGITGNKSQVDPDRIRNLDGVQEVINITRPWKLVSREYHPEDTIVKVGRAEFGSRRVVVIAGPCSVENRDQCFAVAERVAKAGASVFRGGAYKPRTSPYSFQGLEEDGLKILAEVREHFGLPVVTEAMDTETPGSGCAVRRHRADRRAEYAELFASEEGGETTSTGPVEARGGRNAR